MATAEELQNIRRAAAPHREGSDLLLDIFRAPFVFATAWPTIGTLGIALIIYATEKPQTAQLGYTISGALLLAAAGIIRAIKEK